MVTQCPFLRKRHTPCQVRIVLYDLRHILSADKIVIEVAVITAEAVVAVVFFSEIKVAFEGIVIKDSVNAVFF